MEGEATDCHTLLRMIGGLKCLVTQFRCVFVGFFYVTKVFSKIGRLVISLFHRHNFLQRVQGMQ